MILMNFVDPFKQFRILFRHFFSRLFYNDLLKFEDQQRETQITLLALFTVFSGLVAHVAFEPFLLYQIYGMTPADIWRYEALLLTFSMASTGVIAVASWDKLFLDDLDRAHLRPLPVRAQTFFFAKAFSLLAFIFAVTTIGNSAAVFIATAEPADMLGGLFIGGLAHYAAIMLGSLFVFLTVALLQGLLLAFLPPGLGKRIAVFAQMLLLFVFLSPFVWFPMLFRSLPALKAAGSALFHFYPPLWFTGIYNRIIGVHDPIFDPAGRIGLAAAVLALLSYLIISPFCLKKFLRDPGAKPAARRGISRFPAGIRFFRRLFLRHPLQAAVFSFFMQTLRRSREHKLKITLFMALPASFLLSQFAYLYLKKGVARGAIDSLLVSLPLALHFFLIIGLRLAAAYPQSLPANFVFRVSESGPLRQYLNGFRKGMVFGAVLPPLLVFLPLGPGPAFLYMLYSLVLALLLLEACLFNYRKIPFASEHVPGKFKLRYYWPVFLIGYIQYHLTFSSLGRELLKHPRGYMVFFPMAALAYASFRFFQNRKTQGAQLVFEEEPEPVMLSLGLD
jgi:hypothetical protein